MYYWLKTSHALMVSFDTLREDMNKKMLEIFVFLYKFV